jgi:hypothetical protein
MKKVRYAIGAIPAIVLMAPAATAANAATAPAQKSVRLTRPAGLVPETTQVKCLTNVPDDIGVKVCAQIIGHSLHVSSMWMSGCNVTKGSIAFHMEVLSPKGKYQNTSSLLFGPGSCTGRRYPTKFQDFTAHSGEWDFRAWRQSNGVWSHVQVSRGVAK